MSKKVFLDSDVIIDFLTKRKPFEVESMKIFEYSLRGKLNVAISSLSVSNIYYLIGKIHDRRQALEKVKSLIKLTTVLPVDKLIIEKAAYSEFKDFEDGIQNFCAKSNDFKVIITRNVKDYSKSNLSIFTPKEFLIEFEK